MSDPLLQSPPSMGSLKKQNLLVTLLLVVVALCIAQFFFSFLFSNSIRDEVDSLRSEELPRAFTTQYLTANTDQHRRGTCWAFAAINTLESFYVRHGRRNGWLKEKEAVKLSEQAYIISLLEYCNHHPKRCPDTPKDTYHGSDGYIMWLWSFQKYFSPRLIPDLETCPYQEEADDGKRDMECPGRDKAIQTNPIRYEADLIKTLYTVEEVKQALAKDKIVPLVIELAWTPYYLKCEGAYAELDGCKNSAVRCPIDVDPQEGDCFIVYAMTDDVGHFFFTEKTGHDLAPVGGHAIATVGYNDDYVFYNNEGESFKGGFIIKNSWGPDVSHSVQHFMNEGTYRHEDELCPNERAFSSWVPCGNDGQGDDFYKMKNTTELKCRADGTRPGHLHINGWSDELKNLMCDDQHTYCIKKTRTAADGAIEVTVSRWTDDPQEATDETLPPLPPLALSMVFEPVEVKKENSVLHCGYNWMPYKVWEETYSRWLAWGMDYEIKFDRSSYASQGKDFKKFDYTHVKKSTYKIEALERPLTSTPWIAEVYED
ncbi:hypothetical protein P9112_009270 [Eukaryota sp. TZLM1-RC]